MYLTISLTHPNATDLGYLLHKHPERVQTFSSSFGKAHVFYSETSNERCTAVLLLEIDSIGLVQGTDKWFTVPYVNDRPYVASSFLSVAIAQVFGTALAGRCTKRPELVNQLLPFKVTLPVVPSRGGAVLIEQLFSPLGYQIDTKRLPLDSAFPSWGNSPYHELILSQTIRLQDLLAHLYVLIPVLDNDKHYWVGEDERIKLLRHGERWLKTHPAQELIIKRYLKNRRSLVDSTNQQLLGKTIYPPTEQENTTKIRLNEIRLQTIADRLNQLGVQSVLDLGCGDGKLLRLLAKENRNQRLVGLDVSYEVLQKAQAKMAGRQQNRVEFWHGSLYYADRRWRGFDAVTVVEVIEHLDPERLDSFAWAVFGEAKPKTVIITTPNVEYNVRFSGLESEKLRHPDHCFEWTRSEFQAWGKKVADKFTYQVEFYSVGEIDEEVGSPTQMAVFKREGRNE